MNIDNAFGVVSYTALNVHGAALETYQDGDLVPGEESMRIIYTIVDAFSRILNNIKTYVLYGFKNFKRSDLRAYVDSHSSSVRNFMRLSVVDFKDVMIPIPHGMESSYLPPTRTVAAQLQLLDIDSVIKKTLDYLELYEKRTVDEYAQLTPETSFATSQCAKLTRDDVEKSLRKFFTNRHDDKEKKAGEVIGSMKELKQLHDGVMFFEADYFRAVNHIKNITLIERKVDAIITRLKSMRSVDVAYIRALHRFVHTIAVQLDMFGVLLDTAQRIERNYVLSLHAIVTDTQAKK